MDPRSDRQRAVLRYCEAYSRGDYEAALSLFTEDVHWNVVGAFESIGRDAYLSNMTNDQISGPPDITVTRMFEDGDIVVAEGQVRQQLANGDIMDVHFLDVFEFRGEQVIEKRSYCVTSGQFHVTAAEP